jgi:hypothetical protein
VHRFGGSTTSGNAAKDFFNAKRKRAVFPAVVTARWRFALEMRTRKFRRKIP